MNKKQKLKILLDKLNALEKKNILPNELENLTDGLIEDEIKSLTASLEKNPTIRALKRFNTELANFKKDFDLKPISDSIKALSEEIEDNQKALSVEFQSKLNGIKPAEFDPTNILKSIDSVKSELTAKFTTELSKYSNFTDELSNLKGQLTTIVENNMSSDEDKSRQIDELRRELINKINNIGGGAINRKISINGTVISTQYTDINFKGSGVTYSAVNNNTTKQVDLTLTASGGPGGGLSKETPSGVINDSNVTFTVANEPFFINVNGAMYEEGTGLYVSYVAGTITLSSAVGTGGFIRSYYQ